MNPPNLTVEIETDALRGDPRSSETSPRPIPCPENGSTAQIGGRR